MIIIESNNNNKKSLFDHTRTFAAQIAQWILYHCGAHTHNHRPNQLGFQLLIYDYAQPQYRYGLWAKVISVWWTKLIEMVYGRIGRAANIHTHTHRPARRQSKPRHKVRNILKLPQWHDMNSNNSVELTHSVCVRVSASFKLILTVNKFIYNWILFASEWDAVNGSNVSLQKCIMFSCDRVAHVCHSSTAKMSRCA